VTRTTENHSDAERHERVAGIRQVFARRRQNLLEDSRGCWDISGASERLQDLLEDDRVRWKMAGIAGRWQVPLEDGRGHWKIAATA
jgi:hypothetical protein